MTIYGALIIDLVGVDICVTMSLNFFTSSFLRTLFDMLTCHGSMTMNLNGIFKVSTRISSNFETEIAGLS